MTASSDPRNPAPSRPKATLILVLAAALFTLAGCSNSPSASGDSAETRTGRAELLDEFDPSLRAEVGRSPAPDDGRPSEVDTETAPSSPWLGPSVQDSSDEPRTVGTANTAPARDPEVDALIKKLQSSRRSAEQTFWKLASIRTELIPELLAEVESDEPTRLDKIRISVPDPSFVRHAKLFLLSDIPGMGAMELPDEDGQPAPNGYASKSYNAAPNGRGYYVDARNFDGFPLGVVIRAGMINRFTLAAKENRLRETRYPQSIDHRRHLSAWWRDFHASMKPHLRLLDENLRR